MCQARRILVAKPSIAQVRVHYTYPTVIRSTSMSNLAESKLIERLKCGDERAVAQWFHSYQPIITLFINQKMSIQEDADEQVQEVFLACLREMVHFRGDCSLKTWMLTIARHKVADYYRARYAKRALQLVSLLDDMSVPNQGVNQEAVSLVQMALAKLTPPLPELLLAKYVDGKSVQLLAREMAKSSKAIESMLFRARNEFRYHYALQLTSHI